MTSKKDLVQLKVSKPENTFKMCWIQAAREFGEGYRQRGFSGIMQEVAWSKFALSSVI